MRIGHLHAVLSDHRHQGRCILNRKDCVCGSHQIEYVKRVVGRFHFTQFSFPSWIGNSGDETNAIPEELREFTCQVKTFGPRFTVRQLCLFCSRKISGCL